MNALRSELIKLSSLRSSLIYFILLTGSLYGPIVLQGLLDSTMDMSLTWTALLSGGIIFQVLAVIYGAFSASSDLNNRLHGQAFLTQPNRWNWLVAVSYTHL